LAWVPEDKKSDLRFKGTMATQTLDSIRTALVEAREQNRKLYKDAFARISSLEQELREAKQLLTLKENGAAIMAQVYREALERIASREAPPLETARDALQTKDAV
jgi:hypothetical protein